MGFFRARILQWVAISSSPGFSPPRDWSRISSTGRQILYHWASWEAQWLNSVVQNFHKIFHGHCTGTWCERTLGSWPAWMMTASFQNPLSTYWVLVPSFLECFWKFLIPTIVWNLSFLREMGMYEFGKKGFRIIHYAGNLFLPWCTLPPVSQFLGRLIRSPGSRGGRGKGVVWDSQEGDTGLQF